MTLKSFNKTLFGYGAVIFICLAAALWFTLSEIYSTHTREVGSELRLQAKLVSATINSVISQQPPGDIETLLRKILPDTSHRIIAIGQSGEVIGDTRDLTSLGDNYSDRVEIRRTLSGESLFGERHSYSQKVQIYYGTAPIFQDSTISGGIRVSLPVKIANRGIHQLTTELVLVGILLFVVLFLVGVWRLRRLSSSLQEITNAVQHYATGDLSHRIPTYAYGELSGLSIALNAMFEQFEQRMFDLKEEHQELESILANMTEALVLLDAQREVIRFNEAAEQLFTIKRQQAVGRKMMEIVRHTELQEFIDSVYNSDSTLSIELELFQQAKKTNISVHGTPIRNSSGDLTGVLLVLHDLTHIRKLENIRQDFMANVSHELKTPVTSIKGALETLESGAISDQEAANEFLPMIRRQVQRLEKIIDNLLNLSQLEQSGDHNQLSKEEYHIASLLNSAVQLCQESATQRQVRLEVECSEDLTWRVNAALLEEALVNLVENAVQYSDEAQVVRISARQSDQNLMIAVQDFGCGISREDLTRVFERFYRVDKARSRELGGTGLGLAIVKHIARAHGGTVSVESEVDQGSTFYLHIPSA